MIIMDDYHKYDSEHKNFKSSLKLVLENLKVNSTNKIYCSRCLETDLRHKFVVSRAEMMSVVVCCVGNWQRFFI